MSANGARTWRKLEAFQVFGDYCPMPGFRVVVQLGPPPDDLARTLERRAGNNDLLDPVLAQYAMRAGLGLLRGAYVSFVYANAEETVVLLRADAARGRGDTLALHDTLVSSFASRLALLSGVEVAVRGRIYEMPDVEVARKAFTALVEEVEESTPLRTSIRLGAQLRGRRGQPFHPSMVETLEEQTSLLQSNGIDMDSLPSWWWRGVAGARTADGHVHVFDDLPAAESFGELLPE
jgi:hypothetical protein